MWHHPNFHPWRFSRSLSAEQQHPFWYLREYFSDRRSRNPLTSFGWCDLHVLYANLWNPTSVERTMPPINKFIFDMSTSSRMRRSWESKSNTNRILFVNVPAWQHLVRQCHLNAVGMIVIDDSKTAGSKGRLWSHPAAHEPRSTVNVISWLLRHCSLAMLENLPLARSC